MKNRLTRQGSLRSFGILAVVCVAACASPSDGGSARSSERVGSVSQRVSSSVLWSFSGFPDGSRPQFGALVLSGSTLYGTTLGGGAAGHGTVFTINTNGTGYTRPRSFDGGAADGSSPGSLALSGSTLYGLTTHGGASFMGTMFKINTNGTGYELMRSFGGGAADGASPLGSLVVSGSTLYGMTNGGGTSGRGTVFKVGTDGTGYALLRSFAGDVADGSSPNGSLAVSGSTLYGMTPQGGPSGAGTVFKVNTDGTGYALLRSFAGDVADGASPYGSLVVSGSTLYGMTRFGGASNSGTVFKVETDGTGFALLRSFAGGPDARLPYDSLVISGSTLYGMTASGGSFNSGAVFKIKTDGTGYARVHSFAGVFADGVGPFGTLVVSGSALYGMTTEGGQSGMGTVFKIDLTCGVNEHVSANDCIACPAGSKRAAGDDPTGADTNCTPTTCALNEYVSNHACVPCAPGSTQPAGDLATGDDTMCTATTCAVDQYVSNHVCLACAPGGTRAAGDLATGANTACVNTICPLNEYVSDHQCTPCALGTTRPAGDVASGADTSCVAISCAANQNVVNHACLACAPGSTRPAGDLATGADTTCPATACAVNQYVSSHACVACAPGGTRTAGDLATGANTACTNTVCAVNEYVANHACTPCALGNTRPAGDLATGANTACAATACAANHRVSSHACVACAMGSTRPAGDLASGADTTCAAPSSDSGVPSPDSGAAASPPDAAATDEGGCRVASSRATSRRGSSGGLLAVIALALAGLRRRRRAAGGGPLRGPRAASSVGER